MNQRKPYMKGVEVDNILADPLLFDQVAYNPEAAQLFLTDIDGWRLIPTPDQSEKGLGHPNNEVKKAWISFIKSAVKPRRSGLGYKAQGKTGTGQISVQ